MSDKPYLRSDRLGFLIHRSISAALAAAADPLLRSVVVSQVVVRTNLSVAEVLYEVFGLSQLEEIDQQEQQRQVAKSLKKANGFIRSHVAKDIRSRRIPQLSYRYDASSQALHELNIALDQPDATTNSSDQGDV